MSHMEARYPVILFKQQLTASVEKIFGMIRDNLKKEISALLTSCIQVFPPKAPGTRRCSQSFHSMSIKRKGKLHIFQLKTPLTQHAHVVCI